MSTADQRDPSVAAGAAWTDEFTRSTLQLIADGVTGLVGFGVCTISVLGADRRLHIAAISGDEDAWRALSGTSTPLDALLEDLRRADSWGRFRFVPAERLEAGDEAWGWVPTEGPRRGDDAHGPFVYLPGGQVGNGEHPRTWAPAVARPDGDDSWHPLDLLVAPLVDADGTLRGTLSIDLPVDGKRPGPEKRRVLDRYAEQAGRAVVTALERERLSEQVRLADTAREVVRRAASRPSLEEAVQSTADTLLESFGLVALWTWVFGSDAEPHTAYATPGGDARWDPGLARFADRLGVRLWQRQDVLVFGRTQRRNVEGSAEEIAFAEDYLIRAGVGSVLCAPMGAGSVPLGVVSLVRSPEAPPWTEVEREAALEIGHDLGTLLNNARAFSRQRELVQQLQDLDTAKSRLIATVSHELKSPLTAIATNLEMLDDPSADDELVTRAVAAVRRGSERLVRLVEDLRAFTRVGDPAVGEDVLRLPVDLVATVQSVRDLTAVDAARRGVRVVVAAPDGAVKAHGDPVALDQVVVNLVGNAVKYTPAGGTVTITVRGGSECAELSVADTGIGISEEDQARLFTEFFRSSDPAVRAVPGTGLGLSIVDRIVRRHGGSIEVESSPGEGTTFRVHLPTPHDGP